MCVCVLRITYYGRIGFIPGTKGWLNIWKGNHVIHQINQMKNKNHTIISIDIHKAYENIQSQ